MALNPINPGLRRFVNDSTDITRIDVRVAPGAEIEVDEAVAVQLPSSFKDPETVAARDAARGKAATRTAKREAKEDAAEAEPVE